jgi:triosephosphate isomerase
MTRTPIIAGNWKCNMRLDSAFQLANAVREGVDDIAGVETVLCPPFVYLGTVEAAITMSNVKLGAQNAHWEDDVAATGEVGPRQLQELVDYVILGHSERRHVFGESDETVNRKLRAVLDAGIQPIFCVGETLEQRDAGQCDTVLISQTRGGLKDIDIPDGFVIAYEPVWAIGTGRAATAADASQAIACVRNEVESLHGRARAESVRILYGGSVTPDNIAEFMTDPGIDGGLVGGASLKADVFCRIVETAAQARGQA